MLKPWNMDWTSCLVRTHPEGEQGLDHMRLGHRIEVINEGFFYPQARAIVGRNDPDRINSIVKGLRLKARTIATREMRGGTPCEMPIMTWEHLSNLARDTLSTYPSKHEIESLLSQCRATLDRIQQGHGGRLHKDWRFTLTDDTKEQEICYTIWELERVLKEWGPSDAKPLHFYSRQTRRFQAYEL